MQDPFEYLHGLDSVQIRLGLGPISRLLERLHNPHEAYKTIIIGGTNGKGSVAAMAASILNEGGFNVGLYTSPHLTDIRERIRVRNRMISHEEMASCIENVRNAVVEDVSYFEFLTAVAFVHFRNVRVDVAVLEVGMGGRLDATNVVRPLVSVISNISLDHRSYLGNSLHAIAREKGGIIAQQGICVTAAKQRKVIDVLEEICLKREATLVRLGRELKVRIRRNGTFDYRGSGKCYKGLSSPLKGRHQMENAALAITAIECVRTHGIEIDDDAIVTGMRNTRWEGRMEILQHEPIVLIDGAHNPAGMTVLGRTLRKEFTYTRLVVVFGVLRDKDYGSMLRKIAPLTDILIITRPCTERAMPPEKIMPVALKYHRGTVEVAEDSIKALKRALSLAKANDLVCATGSLYLVGEIKRAYSS